MKRYRGPDFFLVFNRLSLDWLLKSRTMPLFSFREIWFRLWALVAQQLAALTLVDRW